MPRPAKPAPVLAQRPIRDEQLPAPTALVSKLLHDMTVAPGDAILRGTSLGMLPMKPDTTVEGVIDGLGTLANSYG